jgi:hypothetical protein
MIWSADISEAVILGVGRAESAYDEGTVIKAIMIGLFGTKSMVATGSGKLWNSSALRISRIAVERFVSGVVVCNNESQ